MPVAVISDIQLAKAVEAEAEIPPSATVVPVAELSAPSYPCDSIELLSWMGWMTAGPPTLAAEALRSAGRWAWLRYRWALEDERNRVKPTADARLIRHHTRSLFSETVGIGAAGYLSCSGLIPSGTLGVANLDDAIDPLLRSGVIRRLPGTGRKQPDFLIARDLVRGPIELLAIECKGTVKGDRATIGQLATGARQVLGIDSKLPLRRVVFATSLGLDGKEPTVRCHAIEVLTENPAQGDVDLDLAREALRDAALIRTLRCAGRYAAAERVRLGYYTDPLQLQEDFLIADRSMVGHSAEVISDESSLRAEVGVDLSFLRALAAPRPERGARLEQPARELWPESEHLRRIRTPERTAQETLMRDGIGIHFERRGRASNEADPEGEA